MNEWYCAIKGKPVGPIGRDEVVTRLRNGDLADSDLVWSEGMDQWRSAAELAELGSGPPPVPGKSGPPPLPPQASASREWFYESGGRRVGPLDEAAVRALVESRVIVAATLLWRKGEDSWQPCRETLFSKCLQLEPPPLPPPASTIPQAIGTQKPVAEFSSSGVVIEKRDVAVVGILSCLTLSLYCFYLIYAWSKETNALIGREKFHPILALVLTTITIGFAGILYECGIALELTKKARECDLPERMQSLGTTVIILNVLSLLIVFASGFALFLVSMILGVASVCLVQKELNKFAEHFSEAEAVA
jgi:hypothetical protein